MSSDGVTIKIVPDNQVIVSVDVTDTVQLNVVPDAVTTVVTTNGVPGPTGPAGTVNSYTHTQAVASVEWTISHNLGRIPTVMLYDTGNNVFMSDIQHLSTNVCKIYNVVAVAGSALCI